MNDTNTNIDLAIEEVKTKMDMRSEAVVTKLEIDWSGMDRADLIALARQTLIIKLQGGWRKNGIPAELKVNATDHKVGVRSPKKPADLAALFSKLTPEEKAALLAKLTA